MKKNSAFLILCIIALTFSANAQLKVNSTGKVGIGIDPDATYNLRLNTAIFVTGYTYPDIIIGNDPVNYGRAVYPSQNNMCRIGTPNNQFAAIYAQYHYSGSTYHFSDSRLKENFRVIEKPLEKLLLMNGLKYDFINQGNDTISNEKEKQELLKMQKDKLGFLAQDLEKILPEAVLYKEDEDRYYIEYNALIPVIVEAIKEQQIKIDELKGIIAKCCESNLKSATILEPGNIDENTASLDQNIPNPFTRETRIGCFIPKGSTSSVLFIYNMNGAQLQQYNVTGTGQQTVIISGNTLEPGMYLYALIVDGREVDTKRMILTK
jgi:hypothetical protein